MPKSLLTLAVLALTACTDPSAADFVNGCDDAAAEEEGAVECMRTSFVRAQDRLDTCAEDLGASRDDVERQREIERGDTREETRDEPGREDDSRDRERERETRERDSRDLDSEEVRREHERASRDLRDLRDRTEDDVRSRTDAERRRNALREGLRRAWDVSDCDRVTDASRGERGDDERGR